MDYLDPQLGLALIAVSWLGWLNFDRIARLTTRLRNRGQKTPGDNTSTGN
jgi:hypothetical protein